MKCADHDMQSATPRLCGPMRWVLFGLGVLATGIGIAGLIIPGLPGVVFLLIALWAFSKSSERMHVWLYTHPRLGKPIRDWHEHKVIPVRAKGLALAMMGVTAVMLVVTSESGSVLPYLAILGMATASVWIITRRSEVPVLSAQEAARPVELSTGQSFKQ